MRQAVETIQALMEVKPAIIAIDGPAGAGKSTLAEQLRQLFVDAEVYHMDDFFLTPDLRTPERLARPGENVDHERFLNEVLLPLRRGKPFAYRRYDCQTGEFSPRSGEPARLAIVEGSYSLHPSLRAYYDLKIFLDVDPQEQERRIRARSSEQMAQRFFTEWIPLEEAYFTQERLRETADLIL